MQQNLSVMKLFPPGSVPPATSLLRPQTAPLSQTYPADFSSYGPVYNNYYGKQAAAVQGGNRTSPYQRNMYSPVSPGQCYNNFNSGAGGLYRHNYDYTAHNPR